MLWGKTVSFKSLALQRISHFLYMDQKFVIHVFCLIISSHRAAFQILKQLVEGKEIGTSLKISPLADGSHYLVEERESSDSLPSLVCFVPQMIFFSRCTSEKARLKRHYVICLLY